MRFFLWIMFVQLFPLVSIGLFTTWWTALIEVGIISLLIMVWRRAYWKHQGDYDDRLPSSRMSRALDRYLEEVNKRRE